MKIVAFDFETANNSPCSACALGLTIYKDGEIVDNYSFLIKPQARYSKFIFTYIHHLTYEDIENEKEFIEYYDELKNLFKDAILIAHNVNFDIRVLNAMCDCYGLDHFKNEYIDTVTIARRMYPELSNHRLDTISYYLGVELNHHDAKSDSFACMMIVLNTMMKTGIYDLRELLKKLRMKHYFNH